MPGVGHIPYRPSPDTAVPVRLCSCRPPQHLRYKETGFQQSYTFSMHFRPTPTRRGSLESGRARKKVWRLRELNPFARCRTRRHLVRKDKSKSCGDGTDAVYFHVFRLQHTRAPFDTVDQDSSCDILTCRQRRRAEMLVGGHVRCDCERHGTLIKNRSTVSDAQ